MTYDYAMMVKAVCLKQYEKLQEVESQSKSESDEVVKVDSGNHASN